MGAQLGHGRGDRLVGVVGGQGVDALQQRAGVRVGRGAAAEEQQRQGRHAGPQVGARVLAGVRLLRREVDHVVDQLERDADAAAEGGERLAGVIGGVREGGAPLRSGRDERARLVLEHLQVVVDRVLVGLGADGLVQLAEHEALEHLRLPEDPGGALDAGDQLARPREQQVAREDRDGVAPHLLGGGDPAPLRRLVHDVVVVQGADVEDLDRLRRRHDVVGHAVAELRGEQREHRPHPLAARGEEVARAHVRDPVVERDLLQDPGLDALEALVDGARHRLVLAGGEQPLGQPQLRRQRRTPPRDRLGRAHSLAQTPANGLTPRCRATMPPVRLRYRTWRKPASRSQAASVVWSAHSLMESPR